MSNIRGKFQDYLQAMEDEIHQQGPEALEHARVFKLEKEVVLGQGEEARLTTEHILCVVGEIMSRSKHDTSNDVLQEHLKKTEELEGKLIQLQTELNKEKQLRIIQEKELLGIKEELRCESNLRIIENKKIKELKGELKMEEDMSVVLIENQTLVNPKKESRIVAQDTQEIDLDEAKELVENLEQSEVKYETDLIAEKKEEIKTEKSLEETLEELKIEKKQRIAAEDRLNKIQSELENEVKLRTMLEERCTELGKKMQHINAEQQLDAARKIKSRLTAEQQEKYMYELHHACGSSGVKPDVNKVTGLLAMGVDCNARDWSNGTPLHTAARYGHTDICQVLLDACALVNSRSNDNTTPLHFAAGYGSLPLVRLLTDRGADHSLRNRRGQSAMDWAVSNNNKRVATFLSHLSADN